MDFRSFMMQEIDGEFKFLPKECIDDNQCSPSLEFVNNEALVIDANPLTSVHPSNFVEDVADSDDAFAGDNENPLVGTSLPPLPEAGSKMAAQASKVASEASDPLDVDSDPDIHEFPSTKEVKDSAGCHWVVAHVTPPSWKKHLRQISIKQLCDIDDRAYMCQVVLDNVLNSRTRELIYALYKATASCDTIGARELEKDRAYAELERKCNRALLDLDKNSLVADIWTEIETLQGRVDGLYSECTWFVLEEKKWINYDQTLFALSSKIEGLESERERERESDRASVIAKVVPNVAIKLIRSDEIGMLVAKLVKASIIYGRCADFEEVAKLKEPFVMETMAGYRPSLKQEYDQAGDDLANASYPFLSKYVNDPYASLEQLLSKKPESLRSKSSCSDFEGFMCGPSSPLRRFILLDNVNLGVLISKGSCVALLHPFDVLSRILWLPLKTLHPDGVGKGPTVLISHCEKGQTDVIDVISYFNFLVIPQSCYFDTTDLGPECIPHDPSCTSFMMLLACIGPTHLNHGDMIPSFRYSRMGTVQLSSSSLTMSVISFSMTYLVCMTSTKTSFTSFEKVIDVSLPIASAFLFCSLLICSSMRNPVMSASYSASLLVVSNSNLNAYVYSFPSGFTNIIHAPEPSKLEAPLVNSFYVFSGSGSFLLAPPSFFSFFFVDDVSARKPASLLYRHVTENLYWVRLKISSELPCGVHGGKFQSLLSRLKTHGAGVSTEDANQKFLRSLPSSWSQVSLIMRTKPGVDTLSFDDLYNNLRVFESDVKGSTVSSSSIQNVAFVSSDNTSSTNEVTTAYGVSTSSGHNSQREGSSSYTDELMYSFFANQSSGSKLDHKDIEQLDEFDLEDMDLKWQEPVGFDKNKVECFNCHNTGYFTRECRSKRNQQSRRRDAGNIGHKARDNGRRPAKQDEPKAMVTIDGEGLDTEVTSCSKKCVESYAKLKKLYDEQREQIGVDSIVIQSYTLALKKVEAQLVCHQKNQLAYEEKIRFMKIDLDDKTNVLIYHKKLLAEAEKENIELKTKLENFQNSSKGLSKLLNSQMSVKDKSKLSRPSDIEDSHVNDRFVKVEGMHAVPPSMTGIYMPPKSDFRIDESKFTYGPQQSKNSESDAKTSDLASCESNSSVEMLESVPKPIKTKPKVVSEPKVWSDAPIIEEYESCGDDENVSKATVEQEIPSCDFINTVKHVKSPRETVKDQDTCSQNLKVDKREWTGLKSKRQGLGYGYTRKACFVCGSFSHLIRDCDFHEKRMAKQVELNKRKNKVTCQRNDRTVWNNVQILNHHNNFVPTAILTKTGKFPVNAARQKFSNQAASTSTVRKVNTIRQTVNDIRPRDNLFKSHAPIRRPFNRKTTPKANFTNHKVNNVRDKTISAVGGNRETDVKASAGCNWRSKRHY
uniref:CCHC-type domain-containing protein n=1 Tax=Tanacetum cinerariifolium TaxID=118510 RepID=A0A6L2MKF6_TANCI|nr:hypothetical protein [Tanacetum cinerariifolium]